MVVLADDKNALDIAGIKGGKKAEITSNTKRILLTAGNFDSASIYKTSRKLKLITDASTRFSHYLSPELVALGITRAGELIVEICGGKAGLPAQAGQLVDVYPKKQSKKVIKFDIDKFNIFTGLNLKKNEALSYLKKLDFVIKGNLVEAPPLRTDVEYLEDLAEEIVRLHGYDKLPATPPVVAIKSGDGEDGINFKDK